MTQFRGKRHKFNFSQKISFMKKLFVLMLAMVLLFSACSDKGKPNPPPTQLGMKYTQLNDISVKFRQRVSLDIDGDNTKDLLFSTMLVGDPVAKQDKRIY